MKELINTTALVKHILEGSKPARNSDSNLYLQVLLHVAEQKGIDLNSVTVTAFLSVGKDLGFPGFETVRRARQKIQASYPELRANDKVAEARMEKELGYRAFATKII